MRTEDNKHYYADEGKVFVRISDEFIMGTGMDMGDEDSIENYREDDMPEGYAEAHTHIRNDSNEEEFQPRHMRRERPQETSETEE